LCRRPSHRQGPQGRLSLVAGICQPQADPGTILGKVRRLVGATATNGEHRPRTAPDTNSLCEFAACGEERGECGLRCASGSRRANVGNPLDERPTHAGKCRYVRRPTALEAGFSSARYVRVGCPTSPVTERSAAVAGNGPHAQWPVGDDSSGRRSRPVSPDTAWVSWRSGSSPGVSLNDRRMGVDSLGKWRSLGRVALPAARALERKIRFAMPHLSSRTRSLYPPLGGQATSRAQVRAVDSPADVPDRQRSDPVSTSMARTGFPS
jgi:hypothetical protein